MEVYELILSGLFATGAIMICLPFVFDLREGKKSIQAEEDKKEQPINVAADV